MLNCAEVYTTPFVLYQLLTLPLIVCFDYNLLILTYLDARRQ